jgi:hypothetical protein
MAILGAARRSPTELSSSRHFRNRRSCRRSAEGLKGEAIAEFLKTESIRERPARAAMLDIWIKFHTCNRTNSANFLRSA